MTIVFKLLEQILQRGQRRSLEFFPGVGAAEKSASIVPSGKCKTSKAQQNFARLGDRMNGDSSRREGNDGIKRRARTIAEGLRFAMRNKPGILISGVAQIDFFEGFSKPDRARRVRWINPELGPRHDEPRGALLLAGESGEAR